MSSTDLVSLEDTPLAATKNTTNEPSLLDAMESEQSQLDTPSLAAMTADKEPLTVKTSQRKSVDFHPSVSATSNPNSPRHSKRQSMSFPVNVTPTYYPATHYNQLRSPNVHQHTRAASESLPATPITDHHQVEPASDPVGFLTVLAGQERRVLELKEELLRADAELEKLKRKWAMHEATRKRSEPASTVDQMRNLELADESKKHARRQSTGVALKASRRTTFNGNTRHQRTLSLLSPERTHFHSFPQPADVDEPLKPAKASAAKDTASFPFESGYEKSVYEPLKPTTPGKKVGHQEALIATGKQMAEDFKEGLWTFIEDLRQATVGEEMAANGQKQAASSSPNTAAALKKKNSKANLKITPVPAASGLKAKSKKAKSSTPKATKLVDINDDFWSQMDPDGPLSAKTKDVEELDLFKDSAPAPFVYKKGHVKPESVRWSSSTIVSEMGSDIMSPGAFSSPRTSTSSRSRSSSPDRKLVEPFPEKSAGELFQALADSQQAPWGMIAAPLGNLKRTATAVLTQLEKGLAPLPGQSPYYDLENARIPATADLTKSKKQH
ncbi:hypothetical protein Dda_8533 [Drechslerella dactyloides]|uniref:DUF4048 domain-containing protein n=1 Tax=Drechslerella dactyloides TaxID=74499 RepID=A0AAD6IQH9_DREDA|nr:hypothetical protein Dda_8533 [Drechslerella dactyloides]